MNWNNVKKNLYPNVILSDCRIDNIKVEKSNIYIYLKQDGFTIKNEFNNLYYRTDSAQVIIEDVDFEDITVELRKKFRFFGHGLFDYFQDVPLDYLINKVNSEEWIIEIVEEFYSDLGLLWILHIRKEKSFPFWCVIKCRYKDLTYLWNNIRSDFPVN